MFPNTITLYTNRNGIITAAWFDRTKLAEHDLIGRSDDYTSFGFDLTNGVHVVHYSITKQTPHCIVYERNEVYGEEG